MCRAAYPKDNVAELLERARAVYEAASSTCEYCSGVYIGKTCKFRMSKRIGTHRQKAAGKPAAVLMVALGSFSVVDIPDALVPFGEAAKLSRYSQANHQCQRILQKLTRLEACHNSSQAE